MSKMKTVRLIALLLAVLLILPASAVTEEEEYLSALAQLDETRKEYVSMLLEEENLPIHIFMSFIEDLEKAGFDKSWSMEFYRNSAVSLWSTGYYPDTSECVGEYLDQVQPHEEGMVIRGIKKDRKDTRYESISSISYEFFNRESRILYPTDLSRIYWMLKAASEVFSDTITRENYESDTWKDGDLADLVNKMIVAEYHDDISAYSLDNLPQELFRGNTCVVTCEYGRPLNSMVSDNQNAVRITVKRVTKIPHRIDAPAFVKPGESADCAVLTDDPDSGLHFVWSAEGLTDGIAFDTETGRLEVSDGFGGIQKITLRATPDEGEAVSKVVTVGAGLWNELPPSGLTEMDGFSFPLLSGGEWETLSLEGVENKAASVNLSLGLLYVAEISVPYAFTGADGIPQEDERVFLESETAAEEYYERVLEIMTRNGQTPAERERYVIDGHPAELEIMVSDKKVYGTVSYVRNNRQLYIYVGTSETSKEDLLPVSLDDLKLICDRIHYDETRAPVRESDTVLTVTAEDGAAVVTAGKTLQFAAAFANPQAVNQERGNNGITWSVTDSESGQAPDTAKITDSGLLSVNRNLDRAVKLTVTATSDTFGKSASCQVEALPAVKKVTVEPAEVMLYSGSDASVTLSASLTPGIIPASVLTWTVKDEKVVKLDVNGDGTAVIRSGAVGKTNVTVSEPGGKTAQVKAVVAEPVTALELSVKGKAKAGGNVTVSATLTPAKPANKTLEWSVDVAEDVAVINAKGQVRISKTAPAGTVITVTCKALGAPEPVMAAVQITVE